MTIFAFLVFFILLLDILIIKNPLLEKAKVNKKWYVITITIILIIVAGCRSIAVGIDTVRYLHRFTDAVSIKLNIASLKVIEPGFLFLEMLIGKIFGSYQMFLFVVAFIFVVSVSYIIYKYSEMPCLSYILLIGFGFYSFSLSGLRQSIALALITISFIFAARKKIWKYLFAILIAFSFHMSALIFLPFYWFIKLKYTKKTLSIFFIVGVLTMILKSKIIILLNSYARVQYEYLPTGGNNLYLLMIFSVLIGLIYRKNFFIKKNNINLFYAMVLSVILFPVTKYNPTFMRLFYYYFIFSIIYLPNLFKSIDNIFIRYLLAWSYAGVTLISFFTEIIISSKIEKFSFFWNF